MNVIKYVQDDNYCLVHKTQAFMYILLHKNNKFYYYEKISSKNTNKTYKICSRLLDKKKIEVQSIKVSDSEILYKMSKFTNKNKSEDYYFICETFGDEKFNSFVVYKNDKIVSQYKNVKMSPTFLVSFFDYKIMCMFPEKREEMLDWKDVYSNNKKSQYLYELLTNKEIKKYKRYFKYLYYLYLKLDIKHLYINLDLILNSNVSAFSRFFVKVYNYYDNFLGIYFEKIIKKLDLKDKLIPFYTFFKYYFPFQSINYYINENKIKNENIVIYSCSFLLDHVKDFLDNKNNYIIINNIILKEKMLLFIDNKISENEINYYLNDSEQKRNKKTKKAFGFTI